MQYIKVKFTEGLNCEAYQEINSRGEVLRYLDENGLELVVPEVTESCVIEENPVLPFKPAEEPVVVEEVQEVVEEVPALTPEQEARIVEIIQTILATPPEEIKE